jgi:hypothetical protein
VKGAIELLVLQLDHSTGLPLCKLETILLKDVRENFKIICNMFQVDVIRLGYKFLEMT